MRSGIRGFDAVPDLLWGVAFVRRMSVQVEEGEGMTHVTAATAYALLGLERGISLSALRNAYQKQLRAARIAQDATALRDVIGAYGAITASDWRLRVADLIRSGYTSNGMGAFTVDDVVPEPAVEIIAAQTDELQRETSDRPTATTAVFRVDSAGVTRAGEDGAGGVVTPDAITGLSVPLLSRHGGGPSTDVWDRIAHWVTGDNQAFSVRVVQQGSTTQATVVASDGSISHATQGAALSTATRALHQTSRFGQVVGTSGQSVMGL